METDEFISLILDTDSYKFGHWRQYPPGTTRMFSYLESRGGAYDKTVFFGLHYYLRRYLSNPITQQQINEAESFAKGHGVPFNKEGWQHILDVHEGYLPITIRAVPEGSVVPTGNVLMTVESTDPRCFWIVSWVETLLVRLWYPITVATRGWYLKKVIADSLERTSDGPAMELLFKLHDFGSRGVSSQESAMIGGAAHLVNFWGSDTVAGIVCANRYYGCDDRSMAGFSIPASEHSTMTMWGKDREADAYANMLEIYKDYPVFACVSDSYDIWNAASSLWGDELKSKVQAYGGSVVVRPDSGDPKTVVCRLLLTLEDAFGSTKNSKGYRVLNDNVRVIQGDGINERSLREILDAANLLGYSTTNLAFGMGGGLLQQLDRDTCKMAFKCSWAEVDGKSVDVYKDPVTDSGKRSKRGRLTLEVDGRKVRTVQEKEAASGSLLRTVFSEGEECGPQDTLEVIRNRTETEYHRYPGWTDRQP